MVSCRAILPLILCSTVGFGCFHLKEKPPVVTESHPTNIVGVWKSTLLQVAENFEWQGVTNCELRVYAVAPGPWGNTNVWVLCGELIVTRNDGMRRLAYDSLPVTAVETVVEARLFFGPPGSALVFDYRIRDQVLELETYPRDPKWDMLIRLRKDGPPPKALFLKESVWRQWFNPFEE
jgi:hypothetical protein